MTRTVLLAAALLAGTAAAAPAALAASSGATTLSVQVQDGSLAISTTTAGQTVTMGSGGLLPGSGVSGSIGTVTVTEGRVSGSVGWVSSVAVTDFTSGGDTIPVSNVTVKNTPTLANLLTCGSGLTPGTLALSGTVDGLTSGVAKQTAKCTKLIAGNTGAHSVSFTQVVDLTVPASTPDGTYTATVTQSVL